MANDNDKSESNKSGGPGLLGTMLAGIGVFVAGNLITDAIRAARFRARMRELAEAYDDD